MLGAIRIERWPLLLGGLLLSLLGGVAPVVGLLRCAGPVLAWIGRSRGLVRVLPTAGLRRRRRIPRMVRHSCASLVLLSRSRPGITPACSEIHEALPITLP